MRTTKRGILKAVAEFDRRGRDAFLELYGFGRSRAYFLEYRGRYYDSKPIVAVAYRESGWLRRALGPGDFAGGKTTITPLLAKLGFRVTTPVKTRR
jgi:hypothetical protein